jgi:hypothetical protein
MTIGLHATAAYNIVHQMFTKHVTELGGMFGGQPWSMAWRAPAATDQCMWSEVAHAWWPQSEHNVTHLPAVPA